MIIGLTGQLQSGKDTVADHLVENYGFIKLGFADSLKEAVATLFDMSVEQVDRYKDDGVTCYWAGPKEWPLVSKTLGINMRAILQRMGTEVGRELFGSNFWVEMLERKLGANGNYVIKDVRFKNESEAVYLWGGEMWRVLRPGFEGDTHASEIEQQSLRVDMEISNEGTLEWLYNAVDEIMEVHYGRKRISASHG